MSLPKMSNIKLSRKEIFNYYHTFIDTDTPFYFTNDDGYDRFFSYHGNELWSEHSGSDIEFYMRNKVEEHMRINRYAFKKKIIIEKFKNNKSRNSPFLYL